MKPSEKIRELQNKYLEKGQEQRVAFQNAVLDYLDELYAKGLLLPEERD